MIRSIGTVVAVAFHLVVAHGEENWPRFRGPLGTGHTPEANLPVQWDASNVKWAVNLPGAGQSSAVNWGHRLFLTGANPDGTGRHIYCLDQADGDLLWQRSVTVATPERSHKMNSYATPTCVTDGSVVAAFFGPGGLHVYDLDGRPLWSRQLGKFPGPWGVAASPVIDGDLVIQNCDAEGASYVIALDKHTGETVWQTGRGDLPRGGWSTPIFIDLSGRREMILNGEFGVRAYNPASGSELWFCAGFNGRGSPVPDYAHGLLYVVNGKPGDTYAVRPGGRGEVTDSHMVWHAKRHGGRDLPSPVVVADTLFIVSMNGTASCYDAKSGQLLAEPERLGGVFSAAPLAANGLVYLQSEAGEVLVIKPGKEMEILARNGLGASPGEIFRATLAPIQGQFFSRSQSRLYCIGE